MNFSALFAAAMTLAASGPLSPFPNAGERRFLATHSLSIRKEFPNPMAARRHGYFRYANEDRAGIIAYANLRWQSDQDHPSQLWYDERGQLIGADFSRFVRDRAQRPNLWGIAPGRWTHFIEHVHFGVRSGPLRYGALYVDRYRAGGGDPHKPTLHPIVRLGFAKNDRDVAFVFYFPEVWVASIWLVPNPEGAFADRNPNVPVHNRNARDPHIPL